MAQGKCVLHPWSSQPFYHLYNWSPLQGTHPRVRRSLWPTTQCQELENLLQQFRTLQISPDDSPLFRPVPSIDTCHNRSDLSEVSGLDLSPLPDNDFDLSAVNQPDWLSTPPFQSLSPELADIPTAVSKEMSETETTSDTPCYRPILIFPDFSLFFLIF